MIIAAACLGVLVGEGRDRGVQTRDGQRFPGEVQFNETGELVVQASDGTSRIVALTNLAKATLAGQPFRPAGSLLPNGWSLQDVGDARGQTRLDGDVFTLQVQGATNVTACHFAHGPMASDGEITARVDAVNGEGPTLAGVMMRSTSSSAIFASLSCDAQGQLRFHRRPSEDRTSMRTTSGPKVELPAWIRLQKREQQLVASYSADGRVWQRMGSDTTKWKADRSWREDRAGTRLLRGAIGVFAATYSKTSICTARVSQVTVALDGLRAEYSGDESFMDVRVARIDPQLDFQWNDLPESLVKDRFSVRWTAQLVPRRSGEHKFMLEANGAARLWVAGRLVDAPTNGSPGSGSPVLLTVGTLADLKVEFQSTNRTPEVRLGWQAGDRRQMEIIPMTNLLTRFTATNAPEAVALARSGDLPAVRGIWLRDGSFLAAPVTFADQSAVHIAFGGQKARPVLNTLIAGILFRPRQQSPFETAQGRSGLILKDGDFLEGDFQRIERGQVSVSSVLFGVKRFRIDGGEPVALVLNEPASTEAAGFRVRLADGSILNVATFSASAGAVEMEQPILGRLTLALADLLEVERTRPATRQP